MRSRLVSVIGQTAGQWPRRLSVPNRDVVSHRDIAYSENEHTRQKLDLYIPQNADKPLPLIIWIHGGAWQSGSNDGCLPLQLGFSKKGFAVASIGYRLSSVEIY